jgi:hypothetical protein
LMRGSGASANSTATFGGAGDYSTGLVYQAMWYVVARDDDTGVDISAYLNGQIIGLVNTLLWTANGGTKPAASVFALPDCITIGAQRAGTNPASPTWTQRVGTSNSAGTRLSNIGIVGMPQASTALASALAMELYQYPRFVGEILASI